MRILLIGDSCQDYYDIGRVDRISPEAPVPVFVPVNRLRNNGMAANVAENLKRLGAKVDLRDRFVGTKTRLIDERSRQQLMRIDHDSESISPLEPLQLPRFNHDAVVISDYDKGTVTAELMQHVHDTFPGPIFVDTKKTDLARYPKFWIKINALECSRLVSRTDRIIVTRGRDGAEFLGKTYPARSIDVTDVCGAGDTFLAALAVRYLETSDVDESIQFAIAASSVTVQHRGVYAPTREEIDEARRKST
jgi:D-beta-D-heptose 7-phosphate kinase/D-beta-D-heptose 1-phosphate adenosyltransferase